MYLTAQTTSCLLFRVMLPWLKEVIVAKDGVEIVACLRIQMITRIHT